MLSAAHHSRTAAQRQHQQQLLLQQEEENLRLLQQQQEQELQRQQILQLQQEQQHRLQVQRALQHQHQREHLNHQRTPPPRMLPSVSQSPRFHEHQRQILLLQQQQEQQQQLRLLELQEQLRMEELERQLEGQKIMLDMQQQHSPNPFVRRQPSGPNVPEIQPFQPLRQRSHSPTIRHNHFPIPLQESLPYLPQNIQLQQRLLSEIAQVEFMREIRSPASQAEQEALRTEAMRKIVQAERMEEKRRKKAAKIAHMVSMFLTIFIVFEHSVFQGPVQRSYDTIRQGFYYPNPSFPACHARPLRR